MMEKENQEMNNENQNYEILEEKSKFTQMLDVEDLINYNDYIIDRRAKSSIFPKILGAFIVLLGMYDIIQQIIQHSTNVTNYVLNAICIICGLLFVFVLGPMTTKMQKKAIRKNLRANFQNVFMEVTVNNEGISFEVVDGQNSTQQEIVEEEKQNEETTIYMSNEQARELEYEENNQDLDENTQDESTEEVTEDATTTTEEEKNPNAFTIPWGGITRIDDDGIYMFINMIGYQSLLIKKSECSNIQEVVEYAKEKLLDDPKRYIEIKK